MSQLDQKRADPLLSTDSGPDEIEQQVIRAYIQLALAPDAAGPRSITLAQFGPLEVKLTEIAPRDAHPGRPPFWLETVSHASQSTVERCGCFEFDEDELAASVALILRARQRHQAMN